MSLPLSPFFMMRQLDIEAVLRDASLHARLVAKHGDFNFPDQLLLLLKAESSARTNRANCLQHHPSLDRESRINAVL